MILLAEPTITASSSSSSLSAVARPPASLPAAATRTADLNYALNDSRSAAHGSSSFQNLFATSRPCYNNLHYEEQAVNMASKKCPGIMDRSGLHMDCPMGWNGHLTACPVDSIWTSFWTLFGHPLDSLLDTFGHLLGHQLDTYLDTNWTLTWTPTGHLHGHKLDTHMDTFWTDLTAMDMNCTFTLDTTSATTAARYIFPYASKYECMLLITTATTAARYLLLLLLTCTA